MKSLHTTFVMLIALVISLPLFAQKKIKSRQEILSQYKDYAPFAANGLAVVCKKDTEHCGCIDTTGKEVIPFLYGMNFFYFIQEKPLFNSVNRMVAAKPLTVTNAVYGIINEKGETILPFEYLTDYHNFHPLNPYHIFKTFNEPHKYGVVDSLGNVVIPFEYDKIEMVEKRGFIIKKGKNHGYMNEKGQWILNPEYSSIYQDQTTKNLVVQKDELKGLFTINGTNILPIKYDNILSSNFGHQIAITDKKVNFITSDKLQLSIDSIETSLLLKTPKFNLQNNLYLLKKGKKYGALNGELKESIPFVYDVLMPPNFLAYPLINSIFLVKKENKWGYIDTNNYSPAGIVFDLF